MIICVFIFVVVGFITILFLVVCFGISLLFLAAVTTKGFYTRRVLDMYRARNMAHPTQTQTPSPNGNSASNPIAQARAKLLQVEQTLNSIVIGHEDYVRGIMLALVSREHVVLISPPGTAKSFLAHSLAKLLNARFYRYLLTKFTDYSELFGPVDIHALANGSYQRRWSSIINAEIVFLDEIFKANSAILNSLLSMLQERIIFDSMTGQTIQVSLWSCIGASNEVPEEEELQALYDRFSIRIFGDYLNDDVAILRALEARWLQPTNGVELKPVASMEDVKVLHDYALKILVSKVKQIGEPVYKVYHVNAVPLIKDLRAKGVLISDRTIIEKLPKIYSAYLALYGITVDNLMNAIFDILPYLAKDRSQLADIKKAIQDALGEVAELAQKLEQAKTLVKSGNFKGALEKLEEILTFDISRIANKPWLKPRAEAIIRLARQYHEKIQEQLKALEKLAEEL